MYVNFRKTSKLSGRAKEAVESFNVDFELTEIARCYSNLLPLITKMEQSSYTMMKVYAEITGLKFDTDPCGLQQYIQRRLQQNDILDIANMNRSYIPPLLYAALKL